MRRHILSRPTWWRLLSVAERNGFCPLRAMLLSEAPRRTLGQAMSERLEGSPNVVNELRTRADQRLTRADDRQVSLEVLTAVFERVE
jgi:hypothetical protein